MSSQNPLFCVQKHYNIYVCIILKEISTYFKNKVNSFGKTENSLGRTWFGRGAGQISFNICLLLQNKIEIFLISNPRRF